MTVLTHNMPHQSSHTLNPLTNTTHCTSHIPSFLYSPLTLTSPSFPHHIPNTYSISIAGPSHTSTHTQIHTHTCAPAHTHAHALTRTYIHTHTSGIPSKPHHPSFTPASLAPISPHQYTPSTSEGNLSTVMSSRADKLTQLTAACWESGCVEGREGEKEWWQQSGSLQKTWVCRPGKLWKSCNWEKGVCGRWESVRYNGRKSQWSQGSQGRVMVVTQQGVTGGCHINASQVTGSWANVRQVRECQIRLISWWHRVPS